MGKYLNTTSLEPLPAKGKSEALLRDGAVEIAAPATFQENLVCVVNNGPFEAAAYCYSPGELKAFSDPSDYRGKRWFVYDKVKSYAA